MDNGPVTAQMPQIPGLFDLGLDDIPNPQEVISWENVQVENNTSRQTDATNYKCTTFNQSNFYLPKHLYAAVEGRMIKKNSSGTKVALSATDQAVLAANGLMPFVDARLRLGGTLVGTMQFPGVASHLRNLLESGRDYIETVGPNAHFYLDSVSDLHNEATINYTGRPAVISGTGAAEPAPTAANFQDGYVPKSLKDEVQVLLAPLATPIGSGANAIKNLVIDSRKNPNYDASFAERYRRAMASSTMVVGADGCYKLLLPVRDIFPILERERVLRGTEISIEFNKNNNPASCVWGQVGAGETILFEIDRFSMWIPHVMPSTAAYARLEAQVVAKPVSEYRFENINLYQFNSSGGGNQVLPIGNEQSRPTKCVVAFGYADRLTNQKLNPLQFDLLNSSITSIRLECNNKFLPYITYEPHLDHTRIVQDLHQIGYKEGDVSDSACVNIKNWKEVYPIVAFNLENIEGQPYEVRNRADLRLHYTLSDADPDPYNIFVLVYSESTAYFDTSSGRTTLRVK